MENKNKYYNAFKENKGQLNEIELGETIGLDENETMKIVSQLLAEHKIEYTENRNCNYSLKKRIRDKTKNTT